MQIRTCKRNGRSEGKGLVSNGDNGLPYFVTHAINPRREDAIDAFQSNVERKRSSHRYYAIEGWFRRLDWALFSTRIPLARRWFGDMNMSRAASLMFRRGPCGCFIELCAVAGAMLALIAATATFVSSRWNTLIRLPNCCLLLHWGQILDRIRLEGPKKCWRSCCVHDGFVMARPCDHRPSVSRGMIASRALDREKWDFSCFPNFIWTDLKCGRACFTVAERISTIAR